MINIKRVYQNRFPDRKKRNAVWQVLVGDFFQKYINRNDTVLDIPCGFGEFINHVQAKKKFAVDISPYGKKYLNKNVAFFKSPSTRMRFIKNASVDKIFVSNFFEHLTREDILLTIKEFKRVLQKGGRILVLQPNIRFLTKDFWRFFDHLTPIDDRALEEAFASEGYVLKKRILKFLPFTTQSRLPKWPWLVKVYLKLPFLWLIFGKHSFLLFEKK